MNQDRKLNTQELIATVVSVVIIAAGVIYWGFQVGNVYEMLSLAYG